MCRLFQTADAVEAPEGLGAGFGGFRSFVQAREDGGGGFVLTFQAANDGRSFATRCLGFLRGRIVLSCWLCDRSNLMGFDFVIGGDDAIDAAHVAAAFPVGDGDGFFRQILRMLDGFAIHVADVERAIGAVGEVDGAAPIVGRGEEFQIVVSAFRGEGDVGFNEDVVMDEVAGRFAGEGIAAIFCWASASPS